MDAAFRDVLRDGLAHFALPVDAAAQEKLERYADRLLAWNRKVNLTAITAPAEVAEKHLVDSLLALGALGGARTLLDVGAGAGLPGAALACARPDLEVTCVDSVAKKVAFVKAVAAELGLPVRAVATRAEGDPERERLPRCEAVVSRAFAEPAAWLPLAARYVLPGGRVVAMLGRDADEAALAALGRGAGLSLERLERFTLPRSGAARAIATFRAR
ncbi:MAG: 16S rRNA (guanine(527)-N(7))-methyltransferase RsmG [Anaeromyxobacter sp.]